MTTADKFIQKFPNLENGGHKCKPFVMDWDLCETFIDNTINFWEENRRNRK